MRASYKYVVLIYSVVVLCLTLWLIIANVGITGSFLHITYFNADMAYAETLWRDVQQGAPLGQWKLPPAAYFFPDLVVYFGMRGLGIPLAASYYLYSILQTFALVGASALVIHQLAKASWRITISFAATIWATALLIGVVGKTDVFHSVGYTLLHTFHGAIAIITLLCTYFAYRSWRQSRRFDLAVFFLVATVTAISDRVLLWSLHGPLLITMCWLLLAKRDHWRAALNLGLLTLTSAFIGFFSHSLFVNVGLNWPNTISIRRSLERVAFLLQQPSVVLGSVIFGICLLILGASWWHWRKKPQMLATPLQIAGLIPLLGLVLITFAPDLLPLQMQPMLWVVIPVLMLSTLSLYVLSLVISDFRHHSNFILVTLLGAGMGSFAVMLMLGGLEYAATLRYSQMISVSLFIVLGAISLKRQFIPYTPHLTSIAILVLVVITGKLHVITPNLDVRSQLTRCLDEMATDFPMTNGVAEYWQAKHHNNTNQAGTWINQVKPNLQTYNHIFNRAYYYRSDGNPMQYNFAILSGLDLNVLTSLAGQATEVRDCVGYTVHYYEIPFTLNLSVDTLN